MAPHSAAQSNKAPATTKSVKLSKQPISQELKPRRTSQTHVATTEEIKALLTFTGDVPTAESGDLVVSESIRKIGAFLSNGTLVISRHDPISPEAMQLRDMLRRNYRKVEREVHVELEVIRKIYEGAATRFGGKRKNRLTESEMQRAVLQLIGETVKLGGSDIHVMIGRYEARVRVRLDGVMKPLRQLPAAMAEDLCAAAFNMSQASDSSYQRGSYQFGRLINLPETPLPEGVQSVRLQFNVTESGRYMVARILYSSGVGVDQGDVERLGYSRHHIRQLHKLRKLKTGMNIFSGATGSGKSTSLQRNLNAVYKDSKGTLNIITIEDPPEYVIDGAAQFPIIQANSQNKREEAFLEAMSAVVRSDPDIIMIGEIRDPASASLSFFAAMTGHQVWGSLHANDALSIIDRLRDNGVEDYKLCDHKLMRGLIYQSLVRQLCPHCKIPLAQAVENDLIEEALYEDLIASVGEENAKHICVTNEAGCPECDDGYSSRTVIAEIAMPDKKFMEFIRDGNKNGAYDYWLNELDGLTCLEHGLQKVVQGVVSPEELEAQVGSLSEFDAKRRQVVFGKLMDPLPVIDVKEVS
ncbi:GspE/PulE family protein [Thalassospira xianhensis]|uniref:Bacterial type II secretion system protein E domain-containing protein n=1 Tax=Thalassospira xianhensis MCCC 1A02616 TaxID=1177929 RepID=A0A367UHM9_9PROT|nr:ATPase, T2SS/T4P/T4SS family [Thalassospira xianhensis]RCK07817.1 hypothetical protein TH5_01900 [Thalassospira xianhensis MCCC 1A02616]